RPRGRDPRAGAADAGRAHPPCPRGGRPVPARRHCVQHRYPRRGRLRRDAVAAPGACNRRRIVMKPALTNPVARPLYLAAETAADLMTPDPVSIRADATLREALALLIDRGFSAAPVIDAAGRPVGVLSRTDLLVHDRETVEYLTPVPEYYDRAE